MKKALLLNLALLLVAASGFSQKKVYMSDAVLKLADQVQVDYKGLVKKSIAKDTLALKDLFEFSRMLDNNTLTEHAVTCLELIPLATDEMFARAVRSRSVKMKAFLLRNITEAQGATQKKDLKKPLSEWAPQSWAALNNFQYVPPSENTSAPTQEGSIQLKTAQNAEKSTAPQLSGSATSPTATDAGSATSPTAIDAAPASTKPGKGN